MVERVNGTIKNNTILKETYPDKQTMETSINEFVSYYNLIRKHGSLCKELNVRTHIEAIEKWYELEPELFRISPQEFKNKLLLLNPD